jgi:mannose-6-phosphate isomerase-like protein (cupin superfamily)
MDAEFNDIFSAPENQIFRVVFFPDRVYHARYLNATRSRRYRYNVREVRNAVGILVMKGEVFLDDKFLCNFVRVEYKPERLVELSREQGRLLGSKLKAWLQLRPEDAAKTAESTVTLHYCPWIEAYQVELWGTLEAPEGSRHDYKILEQLGKDRPITRIRSFAAALGTTEAELRALKRVELAFREHDFDPVYDTRIDKVEWDNNYMRSYQAPNDPAPSSSRNTVEVKNYQLDFQRGWFLNADEVQPVRYLNAMMDPGNPDAREGNIIDMRWLVQRELGSSLIFFHEVTIPPGAVEGTHRHIGTEELYYITQGTGIAYLGANDDPALKDAKTVKRQVYGYDDPKDCKELAVRPGSVIYTKSGGIHGIRNTGTEPLKFVAFLYHTS